MKFTNELVSIIMPTYNTSFEYLKKSIKSVLNQTYGNIELIIIYDDGDKTCLDELHNYVYKDKRVRVFDNEENKGLIYSLNLGLSVARGVYIFRMDADDICHVDRIRMTLKYMEKHKEVDIIGGQYKSIVGGKIRLRKTHLPLSDNEIKRRLFWAPAMCHPTMCFRRESIDKYHIYYEYGEKTEDYNLIVNCAYKGCIFANMNEVLLYYRIHNAQSTNQDSTLLSQSNDSIRKKLFKRNGIILRKDEFELYNRYAEGKMEKKDEFQIVDKILNKMCNNMNGNLVTISEFKLEMADKYFHECLRASLKGMKGMHEIYSQSEISKYGMKKFVKQIILFIIELLPKLIKKYLW